MSDATAAAAQAYDRATAARRSGDGKGALSGMLMALALAPGNPTYRREALALLGVTTGYKTLPQPVLDALRAAVSDITLDLQPLSLVVKTLFENDDRFAALEQTLDDTPHAIEQALAANTWDWFLAEPLLHAVLMRAIAIGPRLEKVFTHLRRHALLHGHSALLQRHAMFIVALALQANTTRFAWAESDMEQAALKQLSLDSVLIRALYRPLTDLTDQAAALLPDVLRAGRQIQLTIKELPIATLTPINDAVSRRVKEQYERFPYPPWDAVGEVTPTTFDDFLRARFPKLPEKRVNVPALLSAGCGTGRGAIMLALTFPAAEITALDLSRSSLAYATMKAEQHGVRNIAFGMGDILHGSAVGLFFDLIESSGVLHHMADPVAGVRALAHILKPGGVMRLALYSERGRDAVIAARALIAAHNIPDTDDGVRTARRMLMELPAGNPARGVIDTPEFFSLDGLHDLIFNVQETRYSPRAIKALLAEARLTFLGFDIANPSVKKEYAAAYPADPDGVDLDAWDAFEQNHPQAFAEMYHLWCRKPDHTS